MNICRYLDKPELTEHSSLELRILLYGDPPLLSPSKDACRMLDLDLVLVVASQGRQMAAW